MLDEEENNASLSDEEKRMWVHKCFRNRKSEVEYWTLYKELADEVKFYQYFRMSKHQFNYLLQKIDKKSLKKNNATFREAI
jgi:IS1 family transposase